MTSTTSGHTPAEIAAGHAYYEDRFNDANPWDCIGIDRQEVMIRRGMAIVRSYLAKELKLRPMGDLLPSTPAIIWLDGNDTVPVIGEIDAETRRIAVFSGGGWFLSGTAASACGGWKPLPPSPARGIASSYTP